MVQSDFCLPNAFRVVSDGWESVKGRLHNRRIDGWIVSDHREAVQMMLHNRRIDGWVVVDHREAVEVKLNNRKKVGS